MSVGQHLQQLRLGGRRRPRKAASARLLCSSGMLCEEQGRPRPPLALLRVFCVYTVCIHIMTEETRWRRENRTT